ncbi:MAG: hypothetical protein J6K80_05275, partial [Oscillospiraceae bacterium]|nr:hypothetical protein [Oscillospiraceae bacterium]
MSAEARISAIAALKNSKHSIARTFYSTGNTSSILSYHLYGFFQVEFYTKISKIACIACPFLCNIYIKIVEF